MRLALDQFRALASAARTQAADELAGAERTHNRAPGVVADVYRARQQLASRPGRPFMSSGPLPLPESHLNSILEAQERGYRRRAAQLEQAASDLENFCALMSTLHESRGEVFRSKKFT